MEIFEGPIKCPFRSAITTVMNCSNYLIRACHPKNGSLGNSNPSFLQEPQKNICAMFGALPTPGCVIHELWWDLYYPSILLVRDGFEEANFKLLDFKFAKVAPSWIRATLGWCWNAKHGTPIQSLICIFAEHLQCLLTSMGDLAAEHTWNSSFFQF